MTANMHRLSLSCTCYQAQQKKARRLLVIVMSLGGVSKLLLNTGQLGRQLIPVLHQISPGFLSLLQLSRCDVTFTCACNNVMTGNLFP